MASPMRAVLRLHAAAEKLRQHLDIQSLADRQDVGIGRDLYALKPFAQAARDSGAVLSWVTACKAPCIALSRWSGIPRPSARTISRSVTPRKPNTPRR